MHTYRHGSSAVKLILFRSHWLSPIGCGTDQCSVFAEGEEGDDGIELNTSDVGHYVQLECIEQSGADSLGLLLAQLNHALVQETGFGAALVAVVHPHHVQNELDPKLVPAVAGTGCDDGGQVLDVFWTQEKGKSMT